MQAKCCFILTVPIILVVAAIVFAGSPDIINNTADFSHASGKLGNFRALIIGIDEYTDPIIPDLKTAVNDTVAIGSILKKRYGFKVRYLLNRQASWNGIDRALRQLVETAQPSDSVLIYYAGHGERDSQYKDGWWIPADAHAGQKRTFFDNTMVQKAMRFLKAQHVLLIADSCYAGTLFGQRTRATPATITDKHYLSIFNDKSRWGMSSGSNKPVACHTVTLPEQRTRTTSSKTPDKYYLSIFNDKSRWGMTSGGDEPVADLGGGRHSIFAAQLLKTLRRSTQPYLSTFELFRTVAPVVMNETDQTPICGPIRGTSGDRGEFVFVAVTPPKPKPTPKPIVHPETEMWRFVKRFDTLFDYNAFLLTYPQSKYAPAAKLRLRQLRRLATASSPQPTFPTIRRKKITNSLGMEFVFIPAGKFIMGSHKDEPNRYGDETQHKVVLTKGFYMQTTEITQGQWKAVMGANPSDFKNCGNDCPVENVSWNDVQLFIKKLNQKERIAKCQLPTYRLPTEAQWEYACRTGMQTPFAFGKCLSTDQANYDGNYPMPDCSKGEYREKTIPVASLKANKWGLYDMYGNVWEWCQDWKGDYPSGLITDPLGPSSGSIRALRGCSWYNYAGDCRSAYRHYGRPDNRYYGVGARLIRLLP